MYAEYHQIRQNFDLFILFFKINKIFAQEKEEQKKKKPAHFNREGVNNPREKGKKKDI